MAMSVYLTLLYSNAEKNHPMDDMRLLFHGKRGPRRQAELHHERNFGKMSDFPATPIVFARTQQ